MKQLIVAVALLLAVGEVQAGDPAAGKAKAGACAACHGANGVSVEATIPNLAGQKEQYIAAQLKAFKLKERKNELMNAIAAQLSDADMENLAAHFAGLGDGSGVAASEMPVEIATTRIRFPADYKTAFTRYTTIGFPDKKQVRHYYANEAAMTAAKGDTALPVGSVLFVEIFKAKLDDAKSPIRGSDGELVADQVAAYTAMEQQDGWGRDFPDILRNGDWNYAVFNADKSLKPGVNQARCLACHKPLADTSYVFSLDALRAKARGAE